MNQDIHLHLSHYIFLLSILIMGLVSIVLFAPYPDKQFGASVLTAILYIIWGIAHHHLEGDLHLKIVIEYTLIALISILVLRGVIYR